jgi:undecaprenyl-diphosphatase
VSNPDPMTVWQAIWLGIVQGLGEFLPISSSGHLIVFPWLLGWPVQSLSFDVALHLGTLVAVLAAFAGDWWRLLVGGLRAVRERRVTPEARMLGLLVLGSIPAGIAGLLLDEWAETVFRAPALVATTMAVMGGVLYLADRRAPAGEGVAPEVSLRDALLIGSAQALALVPGVSRSGATITAGLFLGLDRTTAARFSFLLSVPAVVLSGLLELGSILSGEEGQHVGMGNLVIATVLAFVSGYAAIAWLLRFLTSHSLVVFVVYRVALGVLVLVLVSSGAIE